MGLEKLNITAYKCPTYLSKSGSCEVQINPSSYKHNHKISYDNKVALGASGATLEFKGINPQTISFEIYFDATGVIPNSKPVKDQIDSFKSVCFEYQDQLHEPNYLIISWGTLVFKCKLTSLDLNYTLFQPDGTALRAKASVSFEEALDESEISRKADSKSPDLTHHVVVKERDTLPLICHRVYGDSDYYLQVAKYNNLSNFRKLKVGSLLKLPSLK